MRYSVVEEHPYIDRGTGGLPDPIFSLPTSKTGRRKTVGGVRKLKKFDRAITVRIYEETFKSLQKVRIKRLPIPSVASLVREGIRLLLEKEAA